MDAVEEALARNDRYLLELVERLNLCPFARRCRESGKLERRVLLGPRPFEAASAAIRAVEALPEEAVEVALLIFPGFAGDTREFESFLGELRTEAHAFYCVAFHPDLPEDLADPDRAVGFIRRSPDPTIQMVRARLLERVRGEHGGGSVFLDAGALTQAELLALRSPEPLSDRIARENLETIRREGPERVREQMGLLRKR
jgi:hypothetical protein